MPGSLFTDIKAIRKFGLASHLKYLADYENVIVNLQANCDNLLPVPERNDLEVTKVDYSNPEILEQWCELLNDAYENEGIVTPEKALAFLENHHTLVMHNLYFVFKSGELAASFVTGHFKSNPDVGSGARVSVAKKFRNFGMGKFLLIRGMHILKAEGYKKIEFYYHLKRKTSIGLSFHAGLVPVYKRKDKVFKGTRKFFFTNWYASYVLKGYYSRFLRANYKGRD